MLRRAGSRLMRGGAVHSLRQPFSAGTAGSGSSIGAASSPPPPSAAAAAAAKAPPRIKPPEQLTPEELERALPSMFFTTSNLIWSTLVASGVAAAGLVSMVWLGTYIVNAADAMRAPDAAAAPAAAAAAAAPPPLPKPLAQLIAERKAELEDELQQLRGLPRTAEAKQRLSEVQRELRSFRAPGSWWWPF